MANTDTEIYDVLSTVLPNTHPAPYPLGTELPALTYQRIGSRRIRSHDGTSAVFSLYQIVAWDRAASSARVLRRAVVDELEPMIGRTFIEDDRDGYDPVRKVYRADVDVRWWSDLEEEVGPSTS